jgi:type IV pilus assembly protein PilV
MNQTPQLFVSRQRGTTMIEVLVTVVILAFGLLGIAAFQAKAQAGSIEAYQRAQAVVLLEDLQARMAGNPENSADYVTATPLGTGHAPGDCTLLAAGSARDKCEWSTALLGAAEVTGTVASEIRVGAMLGARGCVTQIQARSTTPGACSPGIYQLTVAWQGLHATRAPTSTCGSGQYGNETLRRAIGVRVAAGVPHCK